VGGTGRCTLREIGDLVNSHEFTEQNRSVDNTSGQCRDRSRGFPAHSQPAQAVAPDVGEFNLSLDIMFHSWLFVKKVVFCRCLAQEHAVGGFSSSRWPSPSSSRSLAAL